MFCGVERPWAAYCLALILVSVFWLPSQAQQTPSNPTPKPSGVQEGTFEQGTDKQPASDPSAPVNLQPAQAPVDANPKSDAPKTRSSQLKLGSGDLVEVSVYGVPELATKARISSSGDLYLPLVNYLHVADLTIEDTQKLIEKQLADGGFVRDPHVSILVDEFSSQGVSMLGEVSKPGLYPVLGDRRLVDMVTAAGGLTDKAGREVTIIHRDEPDKPQFVTLSRALTDNPESNVPIFPGDSVEVHRAPIIYVVGDVGRPSGLLVDNGKLTVLQALALAGGANHTAKLNDSRILRKGGGPNGITETKVQLKKMLEAKAPDISLEPNDILFIPVSGAKVAAARSFEAAMTITTGLAIYAVHP
jgi:polysaccharide export outer membrane protein